MDPKSPYTPSGEFGSNTRLSKNENVKRKTNPRAPRAPSFLGQSSAPPSSRAPVRWGRGGGALFGQEELPPETEEVADEDVDDREDRPTRISSSTPSTPPEPAPPLSSSCSFSFSPTTTDGLLTARSREDRPCSTDDNDSNAESTEKNGSSTPKNIEKNISPIAAPV